jgi:isopentenyl-diphosphate delta-isomerase
LSALYVDKDDKIIGSGGIKDAVDAGIIVRLSRMILFNKKGEMLLQQRSDKVILPHKWDHASGGHVDEGEDYPEAAVRELAEEMGITDVKLTAVAKYYDEEAVLGKTKKSYNVLFTGNYDGEVTIDKDEVENYKWIAIADLEQQIQTAPDDFTDGFKRAYREYKKAV